MIDKTSWFAKPDEYMPSTYGRTPRERTWGDRFRGAMFGGAVGDALGAAVRRRTTDDIQRWFGSHGVVDYLPVFGARGAATDLSQLTVFTLEALLRARAANPDSGGRLPPELVATSHLRWLHTQGIPWEYAMSAHLATQPEPGGWLLERPELFSTRDPAGVALRGLGKLAATPPGSGAEPPLGSASLVEPIVWAAPAMVWSSSEEAVFGAGASIAGLLTGNGNATGAAGMHCDVLAQLIRGVELWDAVSASDTQRLGGAHSETSNPADVRRAVHAAMFASHGARSPGPSELDIEFDTDDRPGELGIALASVACSDSFAAAVRMAINQSADSSVAGALAGQLAGALHGPEAIPVHWLEELELAEVFGTLCEDAVEAFAPPPLPKWAQRYVPDTKRAFSGPLELPGSAPHDESTVELEAERRPHSVVSERVNPPAEEFSDHASATPVSGLSLSAPSVSPPSVSPSFVPPPSVPGSSVSPPSVSGVSGMLDSGVTDSEVADSGTAVEASPVEETMVLPMMGLGRPSGSAHVPTREEQATEESEPVPPQRATETTSGRFRTGHPLVELGDPPELSPESASSGSGFSDLDQLDTAGAGPTQPDTAGADPAQPGTDLADSALPDSAHVAAESGSRQFEGSRPGHLEAGSLAADPETSVVEDIEDAFAPRAGPQPQAGPQPEPEAESEPESESAEVEPATPARAASGGGHAKLEGLESAGPSLTERVLGCFLGGGLGNALAAGWELASSQQIGAAFGADGPEGLGEFEGLRGAITDATQLTLFTAEGLIRASTGHRMLGTVDPLPEIRLAYQRWLHTQGVEWESVAGAFGSAYSTPDGWLIEVPGLFAARSPGHTTVGALAGFGQGASAGTLDEKINESKGCGAAMRAAPVALHSADPSEVFELAAGAAAATHGHPSGYLPAGALAVIVQQALLGRGLDDGVWLALQVLETWEEHEETTAMLKVAVDLASRGVPTPQQMEQTLGDGWVGEQALAIAVCAALVGGEDVRLALRVAVHHSGDSAATGAICGNIVGALLGVAELPMSWLADLELRDVVEQVALDCVAEFGVGEFLGAGRDAGSEPGPPDDEDWQERYPVRPLRSEDEGESDAGAGVGASASVEPTRRLSLPGSRELAESTALGGGAGGAAVSGSESPVHEPRRSVGEAPEQATPAPEVSRQEVPAQNGPGAPDAQESAPEERADGQGDASPVAAVSVRAPAEAVGGFTEVAEAPSEEPPSEEAQAPAEFRSSEELQWATAEPSGSSANGGSWKGDAEEGGSPREEPASELRAPKPAPRRINGAVAEQRTE